MNLVWLISQAIFKLSQIYNHSKEHLKIVYTELHSTSTLQHFSRKI